MNDLSPGQEVYIGGAWVPVALTKGRPHTTGNRSLRWLPHMYEPSSEVIDRVRMERGPGVSRGALSWDGARWVGGADA